jgi:hypothetical protein
LEGSIDTLASKVVYNENIDVALEYGSGNSSLFGGLPRTETAPYKSIKKSIAPQSNPSTPQQSSP